jgi:hypothetical protein
LSLRVRRATEARRAQRVADDRHGGRPGAIVVWSEQSSRCRQQTETAEVVPRHVLPLDDPGLIVDDKVEVARTLVSEDRRECGRIALEELERRVREDPADPSAVWVHVVDVVLVRAVHLALVRVPGQRDECLRVAHRQRAHQQRVHEAEDRRVRADAERQREDREKAERLVGDEHAHAVAQVLPELLDERPRPRRARVLAHDREVAEVASSGAASVVEGKTVGDALVGFLVEMELQFFLELGVLPATASQPAQFAQERVHLSTPRDCAQCHYSWRSAAVGLMREALRAGT